MPNVKHSTLARSPERMAVRQTRFLRPRVMRAGFPSFEAGIKAHLDVLDRMVAETDGGEPKGKAAAILSTMVGALTLSRVVNDPISLRPFWILRSNKFAKPSTLERTADGGVLAHRIGREQPSGERNQLPHRIEPWRKRCRTASPANGRLPSMVDTTSSHVGFRCVIRPTELHTAWSTLRFGAMLS